MGEAGPPHPASQAQTVLPTRDTKFSGQPRQAELPANVLYVPAKQFVHVAPSFPVHPPLQVQAVIDVLATGEREFAWQSRQTELPFNILYVPAKQFVHVAPLFPVHPALQVQAVIAVLAAGEPEFAGQLKQVKEDVGRRVIPESPGPLYITIIPAAPPPSKK